MIYFIAIIIYIYFSINLSLYFADFYKSKTFKLHAGIYIFFGRTGSGKSTHAALTAKRAMYKKIKVLSNMPIVGTYQVSVHGDLGKYLVQDCMLLIDEAGIELNNRQWKILGIEEIEFYKLIRHYNVTCYIYSQSADVDITLMRLKLKMYLITPSIFRPFMLVKKIDCVIDISDDKTSVVDKLQWGIPFLSWQYLYRKPAYELFDSWQCPKLPVKEFKIYKSKVIEKSNKPRKFNWKEFSASFLFGRFLKKSNKLIDSKLLKK